LKIVDRGLKGCLNLGDFINLEELYCNNNSLEKLIINGCNKLKILDCSNNLLTSFDFNSLNSKTLTIFNISKNELQPQDLTFFQSFTSLKVLIISNNPFFGSLKPLQNCYRLERLEISDTRLDSGLEYLPVGLQRILFQKLEEGNPIIEDLKNYQESW